MDGIREIIQTLTTEERREFKLFTTRFRKKNKRKDLDLFEILSEEMEYKPTEIIKRLYKKEKKDAYHAIRKRLAIQLTDFIILKNKEDDPSTQSQVLGQLSIARYLFNHRSFHLAWKHLEKAKDLAIESEHYDLLNNIYNLMIEKCIYSSDFDLKDIIHAQEKNKILADEDERANIANSIVRWQLAEHRRHGEVVDFDQIISSTLKSFNLDKVVFNRPRLLYNLISITRSAMIAKKDYYSFEPFIIEQYEVIKKHGKFAKKDQSYHLGILYMIAHTLYRNKKFKASQEYLEIMKEVLNEQSPALFNLFFPKYSRVKAATYVFQGKLDIAINIIDELLNNKKLRLSHEDKLNAMVNKGIYQFYGRSYADANKTLLGIYHTDKWCEKMMGREWVLKKNMMEILLYHELDLNEIAESRIRSIERNYEDLFKNPMYTRVKVYLQMIKHVVYEPEMVKTQKFIDKVEISFNWVPTEQEDLQAIAFYAWLKSKMTSRDYKEVLLELVIY